MAILDYIKIGLGFVAGMALCILYYEGAPLVRDIPYISAVPIVGDLAIGRVQVRVNEAVTAAQHGYAIQSELAAAKAKADAETESKRQAAIVATEFNNRLRAAQVSEAQSSKDLDDALAQNEKLRAAAGLSRPLDDGTRQLLRNHGFQVDQ